MMCFRDKTFCNEPCANADCHRNWNDEQAAAARRWWGGDGAPVAFANFRIGCERYIEPRQANSTKGEGE